MSIKTFNYGRLVLSVLLILLFSLPTLALSVERHDDLLHNATFTGDFDEMSQRHVIRALVVYNDMLYRKTDRAR